MLRTGEGCLATGEGFLAIGEGCLATGEGCLTTGEGFLAIGEGCLATGEGFLAMGALRSTRAAGDLGARAAGDLGARAAFLTFKSLKKAGNFLLPTISSLGDLDLTGTSCSAERCCTLDKISQSCDFFIFA
jgi:hypothetical protein